MLGNEPKILVMCDGDPEADGLFSGAAKYLANALDRRGLVLAKGDVSGAPGFWDGQNLATRIARRLDAFHWEARSRWSTGAFSRKTAAANTLSAQHGDASACLMFGTTYQPEIKCPTYCYLDATVQQVRDARGWEFQYFGGAFADSIQAYQQSVFDRCSCIFTFSEWAAESVTTDYGIESDRVLAVGGGSNFSDPPLDHGTYDAQRVLFVGKDFERKGGPLIVEAFRRVRQTLPNATLVIAGCDPGIREPGIDVVGFVGKGTASGEQHLLELYRDASLMCLMSSFEPFGLVVIEAGRSGVPCITPDRFAFPETVLDGETGRRLHTYEANELAEVLLELLQKPSLLESMGTAARDYTRGRFEWNTVAETVAARIAADIEKAA
jgi:glycosyltransferase involved in cell wall biosynthesis